MEQKFEGGTWGRDLRGRDEGGGRGREWEDGEGVTGRWQG